MLSPGIRSAGWLRGVALLVVVLAILSVDLGRVGVTFAKEIDVTGTVDCGQRSGKRCHLDDTLILLTEQITGTLAPSTINISWIKKVLPALDQDDEITLTVQVLPDGTLQAIGVASADSRSGTVNQGISTGSVEIAEGRHDRAQRQDEDVVQNGAGAVVTPTTIPVPGGTLAGTVVNLQTGAPVAGATVTVAGLTGVTNAAGAFSIPGIAPGTYQATASANGFINRIQMVTIASGATTQVAFSLAIIFPDITITVVWGPQPPDLDAHLSGPASGGGRFHTFFLNANPETYTALTARDDDGFGPEQIVIRRLANGQYVPGDYHFWVHNFSRTPDFDVSQARVIVNKDAQLLGTFDVSAAAGDPRLELWYVFNLQIDAAGNTTLTPVQRFVDDAGQGSFQVLVAPPYGPKREPEH